MKPLEARSPTENRRSFLASAVGVGLAASFGLSGHQRLPRGVDVLHPFSLGRTVLLPARLGREHELARRAIERKVEEFAAKGLWRLPAPKVEALLGVADAVTAHYGIGHRLEDWAARIPVHEAFSPQSADRFGVLGRWQPWGAVPGAGSPLDWWLVLSPEPIAWGSLDGLPLHALIAHVSPIDPRDRMGSMHVAWSVARRLGAKLARTHRWNRLAGMNPLDVISLLNRAYYEHTERGR